MRTALEALQAGLENVARVIDAHGDIDTTEAADEDEPYYSLEIAVEHLQEAERLLEEQT